MRQYLLSIYQPDGDPPPPETLEPIMRDVAALRAEMEAAGAWVFTAGLDAARHASVVRWKEGGALVTDGPFVEAKEHLGGFIVIQAPDRETALAWGRKTSRATTLPIEVRPLRVEADC